MRTSRATEPECASAKVQKSRPHPSLLRVISHKGKHPGRAHRIKRWDRYQVGMSLLHCREAAGLDHLDVLLLREASPDNSTTDDPRRNVEKRYVDGTALVPSTLTPCTSQPRMASACHRRLA